jgi:hypothetical protein
VNRLTDIYLFSERYHNTIIIKNCYSLQLKLTLVPKPIGI